jgi:hypothetical protein
VYVGFDEEYAIGEDGCVVVTIFVGVCVVGCCVGAAVVGTAIPGIEETDAVILNVLLHTTTALSLIMATFVGRAQTASVATFSNTGCICDVLLIT